MGADGRILDNLLLSVFLTFFLFQQGFLVNVRLIQLNNCICPGHEVTYECTVCGGIATVWTGSLFDCVGGEISLRYQEFNSAGGECNNGEVTAHAVGVSSTNNTSDTVCYISQIRISMNISTDINNKTITCNHFDGTNETVFDTTTVQFITEIPPPNNIHLFNAGPTQLIVKWMPPVFNCSDVIYNIISGSKNCGVCTNVTSNTSARCTNMSIDGQVCNLSIETESETCSFLGRGITADSLQVLLKVPEPPIIINGTYSSGQITLQFNKTESFNISDEIDGSATMYFFTYSDSSIVTHQFCGSSSVNASTCVDGTCHSNYGLERFLPVCIDSKNINVTVHALNVLGNGSKSEPFLILIDYKAIEIITIIVIVIAVCGVIVIVLLFTVAVTIALLFHHIKKARNEICRKPVSDRNRSSTLSVEEKTFVMPEVIYADVGPLTKASKSQQTNQHLLMADEKVEYAEIDHQNEAVVIKEDSQHAVSNIDKHLNLDTLLIQLASHIAPKWYQFGVAAGVPNEILDKCLGYPSEQCIAEVLDYWFRSRKESKPTWKDVAGVLKAIGEQSLADDILKVYKTGMLPMIQRDDNIAFKSDDQLPSREVDDEELIPPPLPPKKYVLD